VHPGPTLVLVHHIDSSQRHPVDLADPAREVPVGCGVAERAGVHRHAVLQRRAPPDLRARGGGQRRAGVLGRQVGEVVAPPGEGGVGVVPEVVPDARCQC
jgi:hypothetical protein